MDGQNMPFEMPFSRILDAWRFSVRTVEGYNERECPIANRCFVFFLCGDCYTRTYMIGEMEP